MISFLSSTGGSYFDYSRWSLFTGVRVDVTLSVMKLACGKMSAPAAVDLQIATCFRFGKFSDSQSAWRKAEAYFASSAQPLAVGLTSEAALSWRPPAL